jgi:MFS transporter, DHA2 family, triacylglyceride efflux pump
LIKASRSLLSLQSSVSEFEQSALPVGREARRALGAALCAVVLGALDLTVIASLLPRMIIDLRINTADIDRYVWVINAYLLAYLVTIPIMGRVSDLVGRRIAFEVSLAIFLFGSIGCALADNLTTLIAARAIQGAGGGALLPVTMALVGDLLPPGRRLAALGLVGAVDTLGWVLGPIWGAVIVGVLDTASEAWRWVFFINVPIGILVAVFVGFSVEANDEQEAKLRSKPDRLDVVGILLLGAAMVCLNVGLSSGGELGRRGGSPLRALGGTNNPLAGYLVPLLVAAGVFGTLFIFWESRVASPAIPLRLFHDRRFSLAMIANVLVGAALIVAMVDVPIAVSILVDQERISTVSALLLAPFTLVMATLSMAGGLIAANLKGRSTATAGLGLIVVGYIALWIGLEGEELAGMVPGLAIAGAGFGLVIPPLGATVLDSSPAQDRGIAAGLTLVSRLLGMTVGISTLTAVGVRRLQALTDRLDPVVQNTNETTAAFLVRQTEFIRDHAIPLSVQVVRETFLLAAVLAGIAFIPIRLLDKAARTQDSAD